MKFKPTTRRSAWRFVLPAAVFTLATFILLPSLETMRGASRDMVEIRSVDTLALDPPRPTLPEPPPPPARPRERERPKPQLRRPRNRIALNPMLDFNFGMNASAGDFDLNFDLAPLRVDKIDPSVFSLNEIDKNPVAILRMQPIYPIQAKMRRIEGVVVLEFVVGEDGGVSNIETIEATPDDIFVAAARRAVSRWKFKPGVKDGRPVAVRVRQKLSFRLE